MFVCLCFFSNVNKHLKALRRDHHQHNVLHFFVKYHLHFTLIFNFYITIELLTYLFTLIYKQLTEIHVHISLN